MDLTLKSTVYNTNSLFVLTTYHTLTMLPWWLGYACNAGDLGSLSGLGRSPGEGMTTHSSILAWRIPWTEEPGSL